MEIFFNIENFDKKITIFTSKPETIYGVTFIGVALNHPFLLNLIKNDENPDFFKKCEELSKNDN